MTKNLFSNKKVLAMRSIIFLMLFGFLLSSSPMPESSSISGKVSDSLTKKPLTGVIVKAVQKDTSFTVFTDRYGNYKFELEPGTYSLNFTYFLFKDTTFDKVEIHKGEALKLNVEFIPNTNSYSSGIMHGTEGGESGIMVDKRSVTASYSGGGEEMPLVPAPKTSADRKKEGLPKKDASTESIAFFESKRVAGIEPGSSTAPAGRAGVLTSGEVNDFRKWDLWQDIADNDLKAYGELWVFKPKYRYTVQLVTRDNMPVLDCPVKLLSANGEVLWAGRTDNTGKAELWANIFSDEPFHESDLSIEVDYNGKVTKVDEVKKFHDGINIIGVDGYCSVPKNVDIVFCVDATGSMGDEINYLKAEMEDIISKLKDKFKSVNINVGSVFYRDVHDEYLVRKSDLSSDVTKTSEFIKEQTANGGGDFPESMELGIQTAVNELSWSDTAVARLLFIIHDAPPHSTPEVKERMKELTAKAAMDGIRIIPVACSGIDKSTEYLMRSLALATNGTYVFLTDESGVGDKHIKPTTDKYDVELLNDLFIRLIGQFTAVPGCSSAEPLAGLNPNENILNQGDSKIDSTTENYQQLMDRVKFYPNPTSGDLTIALSGKIDELFIVDITGKILMRMENLTEGTQMVDLKPFPTGIYFLKFMLDSKWGTQKVMLMH